MDVLNHLEVSLTGPFGQARSRSASHNHSYISYGWPRTLVLLSRNLLLWWVCSFLADEPLQLSLSDKSFYLLLQVVVVRCVMTVVMVEAQYLSLDLLLGFPFSLPGNIRAPLSLICIRTWSIRAVSGVKLLNLPVGGLERLSSRRSLVLAIFHPLSCRMSSCLSLFLGFFFGAISVSSVFMYLVAL